MSASLPKSKRSIVHVVDSLEMGGLERVTTDLAIAQKQAGHTVSVFSINTTDGLKKELLNAGVQVVEGHKSGTLDRHALAALRKLLKSQQADVVHAHNFVPNYYAALARWGLRQQLVQVCTCHDMGTRLSNRKLRWLFKWSLTRTQEVAMVGRQVYEKYVLTKMVPREHAHVVLNGIPVERFVGSHTERQLARSELGLGEDDLVIGCVGRLVPLKNHRRVIDVLPSLRASHANLKLVIIGDGELRDELRAQVGDAGLGDVVVLAGQRSNVSQLLSAFDVFALPSQTEGLSIALLEACATGLAVVATAVGGNPEIIVDRHSGILIAPDDNEALLSGLRCLLADAELRRQLGRQAAKWVRENASDQALMRSYDTVYAKALTA